MVEVEVTNFQSLAHCNLTVDGFTTIIGRNYLGKSALLRAINAALTNQQGTDFIRWGERFCEVHIKMPGLDILWHKEEGNNFYVVNKVTYEKIGRDDPPEEILKAGFNILKIGDQKINLGFAQQFSPLFLLDRQDSRGIDLVASVYGLDRIYKAIDLCNKQQKDNSDILKIRERDADQISKDLEKFKDWSLVEEKINDIKKRKASLDTAGQSIIRLKVWNDRVAALVAECKKFQTVNKITRPAPRDIQKNIKELSKLRGYYNSYSVTSEAVKRLERVHAVQISKDMPASLGDAVKKISTIKNFDKRFTEATAAFNTFEGIEKVSIPKKVIDVTAVEKLRTYYKVLLQGKQELDTFKKDITDFTEEKAAIDKDLSKFDVCPLCGAQRKKVN